MASNCSELLYTLRPRQNGRHFADDIFKRIFLDGNVGISIKISLKFVPKGPINSIPALVQVMALRRPGDQPLTEPMVVRLLTHICVTWPQWVKTMAHCINFLTVPSLNCHQRGPPKDVWINVLHIQKVDAVKSNQSSVNNFQCLNEWMFIIGWICSLTGINKTFIASKSTGICRQSA